MADTETALSAPLSEFLADQKPKLAATAHRHYRTIPAEDYEQAMWVRALSQALRFKDLSEKSHYGLICRKLNDLEFYSTGVLAQIMPALAEAGFDVAVAMNKAAASTDAAGVHIRSSDPFGGAENYLAILTDVTTAYRRLPEGMRRLLQTYYGVSQEDTQDGRWAREGLASSMGLTADALRQRVHRALQRLQDELGGPDPWL